MISIGASFAVRAVEVHHPSHEPRGTRIVAEDRKPRFFASIPFPGTEFKKKQKKAQEDAPPWPVISHKPSLRRDLLYSTNLFTVQQLLTLEECEAVIQCAEARGLAHQGSGGPAKGEAYRDNARLSDHNPILANILWRSGLYSLFHDMAVGGKVAVGLNPNLRLYRYGPGQRFGPHYDESVDMDGGGSTEYTLLVYLTGGLGGGETVFYERRRVLAQVAPVAGMALLHVHGARCLLHEAKAVSKGVKYVLRSDVVFA